MVRTFAVGHPLLMRFCLSVCLLPSPCRLTLQCGFELSLLRDQVVYLDSRWRRQWNSMVLSSEASMAGWGRTGAFWPREVVSSVGHTSERSRFRRCEGPDARDHAFQATFLEPVDPYTKHLRSSQEDAPKELWLGRSEFPQRCVLSICGQRSGNQMEPGYGRTRKTSLCWSQERATKRTRGLCHSSHGTSVGPLYLVDNMSVALAFKRRRAHVHHLLVYIRPLRCRDVFATVRWIPSGFNTSDAGSRKNDPFYDASQSVLARLEEKCRRTAKHRPSPYSSQDSFASQDAALSPS